MGIESLPPVVVFAYDMPHRKTHDVLVRLFLKGVPVQAVLGAPPVQLRIPKAAVRSKLRHVMTVHPRQVAERIAAPYYRIPHDGDEILQLIQELEPRLGVVAGARILPRELIDAFELGILNLHPGLIPEARGLDSLLWSIHDDIPAGVTAHLIDHRVDAGVVLQRETIPIYADDTIRDLHERLYETQLELLVPALARAVAGAGRPVPPGSRYRSKMPPDLERDTLKRVAEYVRRHSAAPPAPAATRVIR